MPLVHIAVFGGLTAGVLALRRGIEWVLLRDARPRELPATPPDSKGRPA